MSAGNEVIFIATIHRMSERIICAINDLQKEFEVKIINFGQASFNTKYDSSLNYQNYVVDSINGDMLNAYKRLLNYHKLNDVVESEADYYYNKIEINEVR